MHPTVAIVMRSKNEMPHVRAALERLAGQTFRDHELHAVDSGSTDGSVELLRMHSCNLVEIQAGEYVPGRVLNQAIAQTGSPVVVLLNADAIPLAGDWLETLVRPILENEADATYSRQVARPDARFIVAYDYQRAFSSSTVKPGFFSAVACAFRRELWEEHPFREQGYAEDAVWARECLIEGARIWLVEESVVEHSHNYPLKQLFNKKRRQAAALAETGLERPDILLQSIACLREIVRDQLHALLRFEVWTVPYNIAYRIAIHAGIYVGLKDGAA